MVCVAPVKNEAWILERFLRAAELWADDIVLADQGSTDATREIAARFDKVRLVRNDAAGYDEGGRQRLLLAAAREVPGPRFIVAIDADEFLTPTWTESPEWRAALESAPGTVFTFDWVNVLPDGRSAYIPEHEVPFAFMDDGSEHAGDRIHSTRIPVSPSAERRSLTEVKVLHMQFADWPRMKSKQRWYQCWEALNHDKRPIQIYRQYHRMDAFPEHEVHAIPETWLSDYLAHGVDIRPAASDGPFWWDADVLEWMRENGPDRFRKLDVWDVEWPAIADPRGPLERRVHRWLARTQNRPDSPKVRWMQRMLIPLGW